MQIQAINVQETAKPFHYLVGIIASKDEGHELSTAQEGESLVI